MPMTEKQVRNSPSSPVVDRSRSRQKYILDPIDRFGSFWLKATPEQHVGANERVAQRGCIINHHLDMIP